MFRSFARALTLGVSAAAAMLGAQAASATAFTFDFTGATATNPAPYTLGSGTDSLTLSVVGGHLSDPFWGYAKSSGATVATWQNYGLGVLASGDSLYNGTHQIDNAGSGVDYVALEFSSAVTLSTISRATYGGSGVGTGTNLAYLAYSGSLDALNGGYINENSFKELTAGATGTGSSASSNVWLVAADMFDRGGDAFKLTSVKVNTANNPPAGAVPEPASWAMMIVGFGAVGTGMRRRKSATAPAAA